MGLTLERLIYDPADANSPNVGAYLRAGSDGDALTSTNVGGKESLDVNVAAATGLAIYAEDSAHTSTDDGQFILAVRNDTQGSLVDTDGDYAPFQVDSLGRLRVIADIDVIGDLVADGAADTENPMKVGSHAYDQGSVLGAVDAGDKANLASDLYRRVFINDAPNIGIASAAVSVDTTLGGINLSATPLAGRTRMLVQNNGTGEIFVGPSGLTSASGMEISKGGTLSIEIGEAIDLYAIAASGTQNVRVLEFA